ncbi:MAG: ribosomal-protein-alanine N-acetyltransferase [Ruminococcaceae bacterium]|nr:ribosomal-protein-alanine N-acetyltransferase [Oscillospiraceae bacterium]
MEIRRALPQDAKEIAAAEKLIFPDPWCEEDIISTISTEGSMCYTALDNGSVAAYIIGRQITPEGEIYRIATLPDKRRRGIAYRLLDYTVKCERGRGLESLFLEVREKNTPARNLYSSYGFKEIGLRKNYYKNPDDNAIVMLLCHNNTY